MNLDLLAHETLRRIVQIYGDRQMGTRPLRNEQPNVHREVTCYLNPFDSDQQLLHDVVGPMAAAMARDLIARDVHYFLTPEIVGMSDKQVVVTDSQTGISLRARATHDQTRAQELFAVDVWGWTPRERREPPPLPPAQPVTPPREMPIIELAARMIELPD